MDSENFLFYKEAKNGQILEEGINEAGSMASFTAAGTAYANYGVPMIPFFTYYSMFGFQRIGDLIWAFADSRGKGFLMGGTAGRTTLSGEGLQHQDGHSLVLASTVPTCHSYDPAYAYEIAVIIQDGIRRMYQEMEDRFYYLTIYNENYAQPAMPEGVADGILRGMYRFKTAEGGKAQVQLFGSGPILNEALRAQKILAEKYQVSSDVWSVTSYNELRRDALEVERWNRLHPAEPERKPYLVQALEGVEGPIVASTRLHEGCGRSDRSLAARPPGYARNRRFRPQRKSRTSAEAFRERRGSDRGGGPGASGPRWQVRQATRQSGYRRAGARSRKPRPGEQIVALQNALLRPKRTSANFLPMREAIGLMRGALKRWRKAEPSTSRGGA